jgi:hypothetical protein
VEQSPNLLLPYIMPSQAQKHVTHNEAIRMLDALVQLAVLDRDLTMPPASPQEGDRYIVAEGGTGEWAGREGTIAARQDGAWTFFTPCAGWLAWVRDEALLLAFDGTGWMATTAGAPIFGVNASADETNRLAVAAAATLLSHDGAGHQLKINKLVPEDTASLLFQTDFSGRAEMGIAGSDDFQVKVSPDGAQWIEALVINAATGSVRLPQTAGRETLAAPRTYYVRADGDDGNDGLDDTTSGAFATIQRAIDKVAALDLAVHDVTIQIGAGTYAEPVVLKSLIGAGSVTLRGNPSAPGDVEIARSGSAVCIQAVNVVGDWRIDGIRLTIAPASSDSWSLWANGPTATVRYQNVDFGPSGRQVVAENGAFVRKEGPCLISGGGINHLFIRVAATYDANGGGDTTFVGAGLTAAFTGRFAVCSTGAILFQPNGLYLNAAAVTGGRYLVTRNAVIQKPSTGDETYFPGNTNGTTDTGGQYV